MHGFLAVPRHLLARDPFQDPFGRDNDLRLCYLFLCCWANIKDSETRIGGQQVIIKRGQVAYGEEHLAHRMGVSRVIVRRCLKALVDNHQITQQKTHHGSVVTIVDYESIYMFEKQDTQPNTQPPHNHHTTTTQPPHTSEQVTPDKPNKRTRKTRMVEPEAPTDLFPEGANEPPLADCILADKWMAHTNEQAPWLTLDQVAYIEGVGKLKRKLALTDAGLDALMTFAFADSFWGRQCLAPGGMWKKSERNGLRKVDNLLLSYKKHCEPTDRILKAVADLEAGRVKDVWDPANYTEG